MTGDGAALGGWLRLVWPLLAVGVTWLYFVAGAYYGIYVTEIRVSSLVITGAVLVAWGVAAWRSDRWRPRSVIWPALATALGALAVSTVTSRNPRLSLDFLAYALLLAALYLLLRALLVDPAIRRRIGVALVILGALLGLAYLAVCIARWLTWWDLVGRFAIPPLRPWYEALTYGNPGLVAAMAALTWLVAVGHVGLGIRRARLTVGVLGALALAVIVVSGTRGAWLAVAAMVAAAGVLALARVDGRRAVESVGRSPRGRIWLAVVAVIGVVLVVALGPLVIDRFVQSGEGGRTAYWTASLRMFADAPVAGVGPGMWAPQRILHTAPPELDYYIPHAHNLYLQVAAELGVVGIVAGVVVVVVVAGLVLGALRGTDAERRRWAIISVLAVVYFGAHQLFDLYVNMPAALFVFALPIAWLDATSPDASPGPDPAPARWRSVVLVGLAAVVVAVAWGLWSERSALDFSRSQDAAGDGAWAQSLAAADAAVSADPSIAAHQLGLGIAAARTGDAVTALAALEHAADADDLPTAWLDAAWLRASAGDTASARDALDQALRLGRQQPAVAMAAAFAYETLGDASVADGIFAEAVVVLPRLAGDPFWAADGRDQRWPGIRDAALAGLDPAGQVDLWLSEGDFDRAAEAASRVASADQRRMLELVVAAWGGDAGARTSLEALAVEQPRNAYLAGWCARVAAHDGDLEVAARYRAWANTVAIFSGLLGFEVQVVDDLEPGALQAGATWPPYGIYTYRRPTTSNHLLPGLPHLQWTLER